MEKVKHKGGVKTTAGKVISCRNSIKHGILENITSLYDDDTQSILNQVKLYYAPVGFTEVFLTEMISACYIRLARIAKAETEHIRTYFEPVDDGTIKIFFGNPDKGYKPKLPKQAVDELFGTYSRYETTIFNKLLKTIQEIERLQTNRLHRTETGNPNLIS